MTGYRYPGPKCQVRNWFEDPIDEGTLARGATPPPGPLDFVLSTTPPPTVRFWLPPLPPPFFKGMTGGMTAEFAAFEQTVLNTHIVRSELRRHHSAASEIPPGELELVDKEGEKEFKLRSGVAGRCRSLLHEVRDKLNNDKQAGDPVARTVTRIGLTSAYRGPAYDEGLWRNYFRTKYYRANLSKIVAKSKFTAGSRQYDAVTMEAARGLVEYIKDNKAAPGFSNHTHGIAVDFVTVQGGRAYTADTGKNRAKTNHDWEQTWFYKWLNLEATKRKYGIRRIESEAWHWEFH